MTTRRRGLVVCLLGAGLAAAAGCAGVQPWQRERIVSRAMQMHPDQRELALQRTIDKATLDGVMGAGTSGSAGCGCN